MHLKLKTTPKHHKAPSDTAEPIALSSVNSTPSSRPDSHNKNIFKFNFHSETEDETAP